MSQDIYWQAVGGTRLHTGTPSLVLEVLQEAFGSRTPELSESDISSLKGIRAGLRTAEPWDSLIEAVMLHGKIKIRVES